VFVNPRGAVGVVLPTINERGKREAAFFCTVPGCKKVHKRETSDWHQVGLCREHASDRRRSALSTSSSVLGAPVIELRPAV
jgi:hypothetical protein